MTVQEGRHLTVGRVHMGEGNAPGTYQLGKQARDSLTAQANST